MVATIFREQFGVEPAAIMAVPGRVNLIGEHTDYNGGMVLPTIVEPYIGVAIAPARECTGYNGDHDHFYSDGYGMAPTLERGESVNRGDWWIYAAGTLSFVRDGGHHLPPMAMAFYSTLPAGSGLSSSAAMIVGILKALKKLGHFTGDNVEIALAAQRVENEYVGMPCGIMDQMAVSAGRSGSALALDTGAMSFEHVSIPDGYDFAVIHSGIFRKLTDGRYKYRRTECEQAAALLGIDELCKLPGNRVADGAQLEPPLGRRVAHVVSEHRRVVEAVRALKAGDMASFGQLMIASHRSYSEDFEASTPEIDSLVERACELGALGARLTGGGFGGCIVACIETKNRAIWQNMLQAEFPKIQVIC